MPNPLPPRTQRALAVAGVAAASLALGIVAASRWQARSAPSPLASGTVLPAPRPLPDFTLTDQDGRPWTKAQLNGRWTLLFAGFTHCPDVCPTTLGVMKQLEPGVPGIALAFLSVDPQRDTPETLKNYVRYFSPTMVGVSGAQEELLRLCAALGIAYVRVPGASDADYTIDHSAALVLIDPQGRVAAYFQPPHKADTLAADLKRLLASPS